LPFNNENCEKLYQEKPSLRGQNFGSESYLKLLEKLRPTWWLSGHMHLKFESFIKHKNPEGTTNFFALDKAVENRKFIDFLNFQVAGNFNRELSYDIEWMAIQKICMHYYSKSSDVFKMPFLLINKATFEDEQRFLREVNADTLQIIDNFSITAKPIKQKKNVQKVNQRNHENVKVDQTILFFGKNKMC